MIKKTMKVILASAIMFTAFNASAQILPSSIGSIDQINSSGEFVVVTSTSVANGGNELCDRTSVFVLVQDGNPNFNTNYAALLTAYAAGREVRFGTEGCVQPGGLSFPIIESITLR